MKSYIKNRLLDFKQHESKINSNTNKKYTNVQCVGFQPYTAISYGSYRGYDDETKDFMGRLEIMKEAIEKAGQSSKINNDPQCLKVFMAPEFFFRGKKGAYSMESASKLVEKLRETVNHPEYKNWLFVFGTIMAFSQIKDKFSPYQFGNLEGYNYSFIQKGDSSEKNSFIVMKEHRSPSDYSSFYDKSDNSIKLLNDNTNYMDSCDRKSQRNEIKKFNYDSNAVFDVDGVRFGVEICVDHSYNRLQSNIPDSKPIDVQLIPSCGMSIKRLSDNLSKSGLCFICDGQSLGCFRQLPLGDCKVETAQNGDVNNLQKIEFKSKNPDNFSTFFGKTNGNIVIFDTVDISRTIQNNYQKNSILMEI